MIFATKAACRRMDLVTDFELDELETKYDTTLKPKLIEKTSLQFLVYACY